MKKKKEKSLEVSGVSGSQFETHLNGWVSLEASKLLAAFCLCFCSFFFFRVSLALPVVIFFLLLFFFPFWYHWCMTLICRTYTVTSDGSFKEAQSLLEQRYILYWRRHVDFSHALATALNTVSWWNIRINTYTVLIGMSCVYCSLLLFFFFSFFSVY